MNQKQRDWKKYYEDYGESRYPSDFARFCSKYIETKSTLIDIGSGKGRDSNFFKRRKVDVTSIDPVLNGLTLENVVRDFHRAQYDYIYARFFLHAVSEHTENLLLGWAQHAAKRKIFLEMRSIGDKDFIPDHYRRLIDPVKILKKMLFLGYKIEFFQEAHGLAIFGKFDPLIIRIIASNEGKI